MGQRMGMTARLLLGVGLLVFLGCSEGTEPTASLAVGSEGEELSQPSSLDPLNPEESSELPTREGANETDAVEGAEQLPDALEPEDLEEDADTSTAESEDSVESEEDVDAVDGSESVEEELIEPDTLVEPDVEEETEPEGDPGTVILHRLNRVEYDNSLQHLLGTTQSFADQLPADDVGYGFDNIASVLSLSPLHLELFELAARSVVEEAIVLEPFLDVPVIKKEGETGTATVGQPSGNAWIVWSVGTHTTVFDVQEAGTYRIRARMWASQGGDELAQGALSVDGVPFVEYEINGFNTDTAEIIEHLIELEPGEHTVGLSFENDYWEPDTMIDRNLYVDWVELSGPQEWLEQTLPNPLREDLLICEPNEEGQTPECARLNLEDFVPKAWRRPVSSEEVDGLMNLFTVAMEQGADYDEAMMVPFMATLLSPHFLFRVELDPDVSDPTPHLLSDHELATRLSYFLWSSTPDAQLLERANAGVLQETDVLIEETLRMLADPKAHALIDNYAGQWLYLRGLWDAFPAEWIFEDWSEDLRASMAAEAWLFVETFIKGDRPMTELLTSTTSFVDQKLADHYGLNVGTLIPGVFAEVDVTDVNRGGILRQGGLLTTLSFPTRTSPVKRGKWILGQLLCSEPPPPPPGVEGLLEETSSEGLSLAEQLAQHSSDPNCSSCHSLMDPLGLGLENFDGIGAFRLMDGATVIDPSGVMPNGESFDGPDEMMAMLAENPLFIGCMAEKLMTYALGRGLTASDEPYREWIVSQFEAGGLSFKELVLAVVTSSPFRMRRPESAEGGMN